MTATSRSTSWRDWRTTSSTLLNLRFDDFNHLVDSALNTERKHLEMEDKKRKIVPVGSGSNTRPRLQPPQQYPPR